MIGIEQIQQILPHRYPFLLVDRVLEVTEDRIVARKNVTANEPFFVGHFPGNPIMPGVMIVEAIAQVGVILAHFNKKFDPAQQDVFFLGIDKARFRRAVKPGDTLEIEVIPLRKGKVWLLKGTATVDGQVATQAQLMATMAPKSAGNSDTDVTPSIANV